MKNLAIILALVFAFSSTLTSFATSSTVVADFNEIHNPPRWEKLGSRKVNYRLDRDEIYVTAREGRFTKLRLKVEKGGINLHKVVVHYGNGSTQSLNVGQTIPAGSLSKALDLPGNKRIIKKVVFYYDTKKFSGRRGTVDLWGRH